MNNDSMDSYKTDIDSINSGYTYGHRRTVTATDSDNTDSYRWTVIKTDSYRWTVTVWTATIRTVTASTAVTQTVTDGQRQQRTVITRTDTDGQ